MRIRDFPLLLVPLALVGCATLQPSPRQCTQAISAVTTAQELLNVLISHGFNQAKAIQLGQALLEGRITIEAVCSQGSSVSVPLPEPVPVDQNATQTNIAG